MIDLSAVGEVDPRREPGHKASLHIGRRATYVSIRAKEVTHRHRHANDSQRRDRPDNPMLDVVSIEAKRRAVFEQVVRRCIVTMRPT